jgi:hypothetical protein
MKQSSPSVPFKITLYLFCPALIHSADLLAQDLPETTHKFTLGSYFSSGDYGADKDTDIRYFPFSYEVARFPWVFSVTAPSLGLKGPGDVFLETGNIGRGREGENSKIDEHGMGDIFLSASYQFDPIFNDWIFVDFSLQAKLPTADETRDLGTGETDYGTQLDFYTTLVRNTYFATIGYRQRGKTPLYDLENSAYASLGMMRQYGENTYIGLLYDYRGRASSNGYESHELMPFISHNLSEHWNMMLYTIAGFTDSSADRTFGIQFSYTLP